MNKIEDLQASINAYNFLDEKFVRRHEFPLVNIPKQSVKDGAVARMTQLYEHIMNVVDDITETERVNALKEAVVDITPRGSTQVTTKDVKPLEKPVVENTPEPVLDEEQQELEEAGQTVTNEDASVEENPPVEVPQTSKREIPSSERLAFDEKLKAVLKEGNDGKRKHADVHNEALLLIKEFFADSTETQLCGKTTNNNKERNRYISQIRSDMKNEKRELKLRTREILTKLKDEAVKAGKDINKPHIMESLRNEAEAEAMRIMEAKKGELNKVRNEMLENGEVKPDSEPIPDTVELEEEEIVDDKDKIVEEAHEKAIKQETTLLKNDGLEGTTGKTVGESLESEIPTGEEIAAEDDESEDSEDDEYQDVADKIDEELRADNSVESTPEEDEEENEEDELEEDEPEETATNTAPVDNKTLVLNPEDFDPGKSAEAAAQAATNEETSKEKESISIADMTFATTKDLVLELRKLIYDKESGDGKKRLDFHENRNDCLVAVQAHCKDQAWSNNAAAVHKFLNQVLSDYIKEQKKEQFQAAG